MSGHLELGPNQRPDIRRKIVLVGDCSCGKTSLLMVYGNNRLPEVVYLPNCSALICVAAASSFDIHTHSLICSPSQESRYIPVVFDYVTNRRFDGKIVQVAFWDTISQDEGDRLRSLAYLESHAILLVFSVDFPESLENIREKWWPEVTQFGKGTPLVVVATKTDLREDDKTRRILGAQGQMPVTSKQGEEVAREIGAKYIECSAKTGGAGGVHARSAGEHGV